MFVCRKCSGVYISSFLLCRSYTQKDREHVVRFSVTMEIKSAIPIGEERVKQLTARRLTSECVCVRPSDKYG